MRRLTHLILAALVLSLAGCVTATRPAYKDMADHFPDLDPGSSRIFFYLTEYPVKTALIKVDGQRAGTLSSMSFFHVDRPAGEVTVQVFRGQAGIISMDKIVVTLSPGEARYVEVLGIDRRLRLLLTDPADAEHTIRECIYFEPSSGL